MKEYPISLDEFEKMLEEFQAVSEKVGSFSEASSKITYDEHVTNIGNQEILFKNLSYYYFEAYKIMHRLRSLGI